MPLLGGPHQTIAMMFSMKKLEWLGYPMEKNFEDMFICFDRIHKHDRRTMHDGIGRAWIASWGKN